MDINERVRMIINSQNLTASAFADKIGVQRSNVSHVLAGRNKPSFEFIEKLLLAFPNVSSDWLLVGRMPNSEQQSQFNSPVEKTVSTSPKEEKVKKVVKVMVFYDDFSIETFNKQLTSEE